MRRLMGAWNSQSVVQRARWYFGTQAIAGLLWWCAVAVSPAVRRNTLGSWNAAVVAVPDLALFVGASALAALTGRRGWGLVTTVWTVGVTLALAVVALSDRVGGAGLFLMTFAVLGSVVSCACLWFGRLPTTWFFTGPFQFREARDRSSAGHVRNSLSQLVVFWSFFLLFVPSVLAWFERRLRLDIPALASGGVRPAGALVFAAGSAMGLWSCLSMAIRGQGTPLPAATARHLVVAGPYRFVRNPMAVAGAIQTIGVGLWFGTWLPIVAAALGGVLWHGVIRPEEELDLQRRFGAPYDAYRAEVQCWIPRLRSRR